MHTVAAILVDTSLPLVIEELEIPPLKPGQVLVEISFSGICHTQILEARGHRGKDSFLPHCLGHEGSGIVKEISDTVTKVKVGDHVILSWIKGSGANVQNTVYQWKGRRVNAGAITTFSKYSVISENRLTVIPLDFPLKEASFLGCAIPTGLGAVLNTAQPKAGESLAVFGCGGIGLCAIRGALIAGCIPLIAIDINPQKLELARKIGATHLINASQEDPVEVLRNIASLDYAIEASGHPIAMNQALCSVRNHGGCAVIVGNAHHGQNLSIDPIQFNLGKRLLGTWGGDNQPDIHFPRYCNLIRYGAFQVAPLISQIYSLSQTNQALIDLEMGKTIRPLIDMNLSV